MNLEGIYSKMNEWTNQFNNWCMNEGGAQAITDSAIVACVSLALLCFVGLFFERRNTATMKLSNQQTGTYGLALILNWVIGTMGAFLMVSHGMVLLGSVTLAMIYLVPTSRSLTCQLSSTMLAKVPDFFYQYSWKEKRERRKKISAYLHKKLKCDYPEMV